jgi:transcriptional regulator with XRE-family HTH domain
MVTLREFLKKNDITQEEFASHLGISTRTVVNVLLGHDIKLSIALKIKERTFGKVNFDELLKTHHHQPNADENKNANESQTPSDERLGFDNVS